MDARHQPPELEWRDGVPVSTRFADPYYSLGDGMAETRHVFLAGNGLPDRFKPGFHIAELGFGTGLNFLVALEAFRASGVAGPLVFTSFEAYPISAEARAQALAQWPDLPTEALDGFETEAVGSDYHLRVILGDARETLPEWQGKAGAWFLDGFAPARNPELWEDALMSEVARHTAPGGTCATYTAAGHVRRALEEAGFDVERCPGFGRKRHMTRGRLR